MYTEAQESNNKLLQEKELFISGIYLNINYVTSVFPEYLLRVEECISGT